MNGLWFYQLPLLGRCGIEGNETYITRILLGHEAVGESRGEESAAMSETARQLAEYAEGKRLRFDIPVCPAGTAFQQKVWELLAQIPWGEYRTYGQLAMMLGTPGASRAVGKAVGANPIPILIPCHRVLAAGEALGGFRLGTELKEKLLKLEHIPYRDRKIEKI